jgi:hypothetical protein
MTERCGHPLQVRETNKEDPFCARPKGHPGKHLSTAALEKQRAHNTDKETKLRKRRWERENRHRFQDECPDCGGIKFHRSKRCAKCHGIKAVKAMNRTNRENI